MNFLKISILAAAIVCIGTTSMRAQDIKQGLDLNFVTGLNLGATTPVPVPSELDLTGFQFRFNPRLGANLTWWFDDHWGAGAGLTLDWKGMNFRAGVTDVHLSLDVPNLGTLTGYVTGRNKTSVSTMYLTQPVYATYRFNPKWQIRAGVYFAEALSRQFHGEVHDVDIVVETPIIGERRIPYATFNYGDDARRFDLGVLAGGEFRLNRIVGFYSDFSWGLKPYFSRTVPIHFTMRNIYLSLGATFRIK